MTPQKNADPLVNVSKLGYVAIGTPDVDAQVEYYTDALGLALVERDGDKAYLTTGFDHHCVVLEKTAEPAPRSRLGMQIRGSLDDAEKALAGGGISAEKVTDFEPGIAAALVIEEPGGTPIHLYESQKNSGEPCVLGIRPSKLGHVASYVTDIEEIQSFYEDVLGFRWSDTVGDFFIFMRCGPDHHAMNFMKSTIKQGTFHIAFEARDFMHLKDMLDHIGDRGYKLEWGPGRHGAGHNIFCYHPDPDGTYIEIFTEIDLIFDEETAYFEPRPWHETFPQGPRVWIPEPDSANKWGPLNAEMNAH